MIIRDFTLTYRDDTTLFHGLNLSFVPGSYTLICGPTGSGKSSLAFALAGCSSATVTGTIDGGPAAVVWQDPAAQMCGRSLLDEARLPLDYRNIDASTGTARAFELLQKVRLDHLPADRDPMRLSGGEQQRLAFAASLAQDTPVLVLDEATSQLDRSARATFLQTLTSATDKTIIAIDHNVDCHLPYLDRMIILGPEGTIEWDGPAPPPNPGDYGIRMPGSSFPTTISNTGDAQAETIDLGFAKLALGSIMAVLGPNGSGKSTLLRELTNNRKLLRKGIAWSPQRGAHYLLRGSVAEELDGAFPAADVGLAAQTTTHPLMLSGGQRQRLALARALGDRTRRLALLDEPSYSQDLTGTRQVIDMIARDASRRVTLMATHDTLLIDALATHRLRLRNGEIQDIEEVKGPSTP